jgi:hypothetical protein
MAPSPSGPADPQFEREKWEKDVELREREIEIKQQEVLVKNREATVKEREQRLKGRELRIKLLEYKRSRLTNPLVLAILGASIAGTFTAVGAGIAAWTQIQNESTRVAAQQEIERSKTDSQLILEMIKTNNDTRTAKANLEFVIGAGLIADEKRRGEITKFLKGPQQPPSLPAATSERSNPYVRLATVRCIIPKDADLRMLVLAMQAQLGKLPTVNLKAGVYANQSASITADVFSTDGSIIGAVLIGISKSENRGLVSQTVSALTERASDNEIRNSLIGIATETRKALEGAVGGTVADCFGP